MRLEQWEPVARRLVGAYPNVPASPETVLVYFEQLEEFDADLVAHVIASHTRESVFFPTVAELVKRIVPEQEARDQQRIYALDGEEASRLIEATEKMRLDGTPIRVAARAAGLKQDVRTLPLPGTRPELPE